MVCSKMYYNRIKLKIDLDIIDYAGDKYIDKEGGI